MALSNSQYTHVQDQDRHTGGPSRNSFTRRVLPRFALVAGAVLVSTIAIPSPATAAGTSLSGAPVLLSDNTLDLLSDETLTNAIEQYEAEQAAAAEEQEARKSAWRSERAAAVAAQLAAELAQREAEAAQQALAAAESTAAQEAAGTSTGSSSSVSRSGSTAAAAPSAAIPSGSGFTGIPNIARTVVRGDITATQAGQVIDSVDVHGRIIIKAPNVTIRNSIVRGADGGSAHGIVDAMAGQPGLRIHDTWISASAPNPSVNGIMGSNFELRNVEITNVVDSVHVAGSNVLITDSWFHDNLHYAAGVDPHHADGSHDDSVQVVGGTNITITRTILEGTYNAAVMIAPDRSAIGNVTITGNRINGGGCSINISEKGKGALPGINISNNTFGTDTRNSRCAIVSPVSTQIQATGNRFTDGLVVNITKGS